jgi:hypothetical protein
MSETMQGIIIFFMSAVIVFLVVSAVINIVKQHNNPWQQEYACTKYMNGSILGTIALFYNCNMDALQINESLTEPWAIKNCKSVDLISAQEYPWCVEQVQVRRPKK